MSTSFREVRPTVSLNWGRAKKVYVKSDQLEWVGMATGALDAVKRALDGEGSNKALDGYFFYIDERGFRSGRDAEYAVPIDIGLEEAGYKFDNPDEADD